MTLKEEYKKWLIDKPVRDSKWRTLTNEQRWFVFMNARIARQPKVLNAKTVIQTPVGMVWSRRNI